VLPSVEPGYLQELIPREAPQEPEHWQDVLADIDRVIMPGVRGPILISDFFCALFAIHMHIFH